MSQSGIHKSPLDILTDKSKWMKHRYSNKSNTRFCIQGALNHLGISGDDYYRWEKTILQSIREHFPERVEKWTRERYGISISTFNDSSQTTFSQVHKVLKDAELKFEMEE